MKRRRLVILLTILSIITGTIWILWVRPKRVDMTQFAPANSLLYVEVNDPNEVLTALASTEAWRLTHDVELFGLAEKGQWGKTLLKITGIGPINSVIFSRAQVAVVVTGVETTESQHTLRVKPEAALIVETHTSEGRIRAPIERHLERFATTAYENPSLERRMVDGANILEWRDKNGRGSLVTAFIGSIVVVGNSQQVVDACISVIRRRAPSLDSNNDLQNARVTHTSANTLVFGYIPAESSPKLIAAGIPLLVGQVISGAEFQRLIDNAAKKFIGSLVWTSQSFRGGIEDRYQIHIRPEITAELRPHFGPPGPLSASRLTPNFSSVTIYNLKDPLAAWQSLKTSVSGRIDTVAAVLFNTTLKSSLYSYGVEDPETFLSAVRSPLITMRLDSSGERSILVGAVNDRAKLNDYFAMRMRLKAKSVNDPSTSIMENSTGTVSVALSNSIVVIGHPADIQQYYRLLDESDRSEGLSAERYANGEGHAHIVTFADDSERVRRFLSVIAHLNQRHLPTGIDSRIATLPYAATQTTLTETGLLRITRSPVGQFSTFLPMLVPSRVEP